MSDVEYIPIGVKEVKSLNTNINSEDSVKQLISNLGRSYKSGSLPSIYESKSTDILKDLQNFTQYCLGVKNPTPHIYLYPAYLTDSGIKFISREALNSFISYREETLPKICLENGLTYNTVRRWKLEASHGKEFKKGMIPKLLRLFSGIRVSKNCLETEHKSSLGEDFLTFYKTGNLPKQSGKLGKFPTRKLVTIDSLDNSIDLDLLIDTLESYKRYLIADIDHIVKDL